MFVAAAILKNSSAHDSRDILAIKHHLPIISMLAVQSISKSCVGVELIYEF